eukprot:scaffold166858_cov30-Tisochrysis_lutea.AAC.3
MEETQRPPIRSRASYRHTLHPAELSLAAAATPAAPAPTTAHDGIARTEGERGEGEGRKEGLGVEFFCRCVRSTVTDRA